MVILDDLIKHLNYTQFWLIILIVAQIDITVMIGLLIAILREVRYGKEKG